MNIFVLFVIGLVLLSSFVFVNAQTVIPWDEFAFSDFGYDNKTEYGIFSSNMEQISILQAGNEYHVIQKADFESKDLINKGIVNATIGFAIQPGDNMIRPPQGENVTEADHRAFAKSIPARNEEFLQHSVIGNSYDFVVDLDKPFYIKFPLVINESGLYTKQFFKKTFVFEGPTSYGMGGLNVVDKYSKAVKENGGCKKEGFRLLIKHDFSNLVCVDPAHVLKFKQRGWAL